MNLVDGCLTSSATCYVFSSPLLFDNSFPVAAFSIYISNHRFLFILKNFPSFPFILDF